MLRGSGIRGALRLNREMIGALAATRAALDGYYRRIPETELRALKFSERAFVCGSGYSLNEITPEEWQHISEDVTVGFNAFVYQEWVKVNFHVIRGWGEGADPSTLSRLVEDFGSLVARNPYYRDTVFVCQDEYTAMFARRLLSNRGLPKRARIFPYHTNRTSLMPGRLFSGGLVHGTGTLCDAINFASCMGYSEIVLVGVDLYDSRYFWIEPDKTFAVDEGTGERLIEDTTDRGQRFDEPHSTATSGVVSLMANWHEHLKAHGIRLLVYNPKSLLADVMPIYHPPNLAESLDHDV